jgi:hypothetical protein
VNRTPPDESLRVIPRSKRDKSDALKRAIICKSDEFLFASSFEWLEKFFRIHLHSGLRRASSEECNNDCSADSEEVI